MIKYQDGSLKIKMKNEKQEDIEDVAYLGQQPLHLRKMLKRGTKNKEVTFVKQRLRNPHDRLKK